MMTELDKDLKERVRAILEDASKYYGCPVDELEWKIGKYGEIKVRRKNESVRKKEKERQEGSQEMMNDAGAEKDL